MLAELHIFATKHIFLSCHTVSLMVQQMVAQSYQDPVIRNNSCCTSRRYILGLLSNISKIVISSTHSLVCVSSRYFGNGGGGGNGVCNKSGGLCVMRACEHGRS